MLGLLQVYLKKMELGVACGSFLATAQELPRSARSSAPGCSSGAHHMRARWMGREGKHLYDPLSLLCLHHVNQMI